MFLNDNWFINIRVPQTCPLIVVELQHSSSNLLVKWIYFTILPFCLFLNHQSFLLPVSGSEEQIVTVLLVSLCRLTESEAADHHQGHNLGVQGTVRVKKHKLCCANHRPDSIWISSSSALSEIQTVWEREKGTASLPIRGSVMDVNIFKGLKITGAVSERTFGGELPKTWTNWVSKFHVKTANCCERRSSNIRGGEWEVRAEKEIKKECEGTAWRCVYACSQNQRRSNNVVTRSTQLVKQSVSRLRQRELKDDAKRGNWCKDGFLLLTCWCRRAHTHNASRKRQSVPWSSKCTNSYSINSCVCFGCMAPRWQCTTKNQQLYQHFPNLLLSFDIV